MNKIITSFFSLAYLSFIVTPAFAGNNAAIIYPNRDPSRIPFSLNTNLKEGTDYLANTIIFKVKPAYSQNCQKTSVNGILAIQDFLNNIGSLNLGKIFPNHTSPVQERNAIGQPLADLSTIYSCKYSGNIPLEKVINQMKSLGYFEYVEPWYIPKVQFVPDDGTLYTTNQFHLKGNVAGSLDAQNAWDLTTGNSSVVIGIVDTGTEPTHPDLAGNYIGGYDVAMNDADPTWQGSNHGCAVSGDACAVTNNTTGVASPGFNCKYKAVKISDAAGTLIAAYQGIVWAADNGCKIINCSWGGAGGGSYGQGIIDYAVINKNCLVMCAGGNGSVEESIYPASYNNTFRVAATTSADARSGFASYGLDVDFSAPGTSIYSTTNGIAYGSMSGTTMATGISSGAAGLVQSYFNYTNAQQIGEKLKQTCDPYTGASTITLFNAGKLGKGRIDLYKALTQSAQSMVMNPITVTDGNDDVLMPNEPFTISGTFINYLDPATAATATLSIVSGPGTINNGNYSIGGLATLGTNAMSTPFSVTVQAGAAVNAVIKFKVTITDGAYSSSQYFDVNVNSDFLNIVANDVHTTITSKGRIGYNSDAQQLGLGFEYQIPTPKNLLYEMSLMVGTSTTKVSDMFREAGTGNSDFVSVTRAYHITSSPLSNYDVDGKFNDAPAANGPLPIEVHHRAFAWTSAPDRKYIILKYVLKNTGAGTLSNLYAGIVADWDIISQGQNKCSFDAGNKMGYSYDVSPGGLYAGVKLLSSSAPVNNYCIDAVAGGNGGIDIASDFLTAEKYTALSTSRNNDGFSASGGDVLDCVSSGPFTVNAGDSIVVAFALIAGDNLADLQTSASAAQTKYITQIGGCSTISSNATVGPVSCYGGSNGSIGLTPLGGTAPYSYAWSNGSTVEDQLGITAGTYSVLITDNLGCTGTSTSTVSQPTQLVVTPDSIHNITSCGTSNGGVFITASGGTVPYTYLWSPGAKTTQDITGISAGNYSVQVTDAMGCTKSSGGSVANMSGFTAALDSTHNVKCNGGNNGGVFVSANGGTLPYSFAWSNSSTTEDITGITAATYSVVITDASSCSYSLYTTISQPAALTASATVTPEACPGNGNGSIDLSVAGGTPSYIYVWNPNSQTTQDISGLAPGNYSVTVTDSKGCSVLNSYSVNPATPLLITVDSTKKNSCSGGNNGAAYISVSGGTSPYSYMWSQGSLSTQDITGLNAGTYSVWVTDNKGCTASNTVTISAPATLSVTAGAIIPAGCSFSNGSISVNAGGGTPGYTYAWLPSGGTADSANGIPSGNYSVTITDSKGCSASLATLLGDSCDYVWPGDANDDGQADNMDILAIGIGNGDTGPIRSGASLTWIGLPCTNWTNSLPTGNVNYKHIDCNGDGTIDNSDTTAVVQNFGRIHNNKIISPVINANTDIYTKITTDSTGSGGSLVTVQIGLGTVTNPATNVYGVAYQISFSDALLVDLSSISFKGLSSWMGTPGTNLITVGFPNGETAVTRTNHTNASGNGFIQQMQFKTSGSLNGSGNSAPLTVSILNPTVISYNETIIPVNPVSDSLLVMDSALVTSVAEPDFPEVVVYPNPTKGEFTICNLNSTSEIIISNVLGEVISRKKVSSKQEKINIKNAANGIYFLQIRTANRISTKKITKE